MAALNTFIAVGGIMNLLNAPFVPNGNYVCTWETQEAVAKKYNVEGENIPAKQRNVMNAEMLFGENSLYHIVPKEFRGSLYFLIDDGWDVPYNANSEKSRAPFGSLILDAEKFPGYGEEPAQRLKTLSEKVKELGYAGLGLWISPQIPFESEETTLEDAYRHWAKRAKWCNEAGVKYWKVDWGKHHAQREYLELMTDCVKKYAPKLHIEHSLSQGPFAGTKSPEDAIAKKMAELFEVSDYFRTYDVIEPFVENQTLCRLDGLLSNVDLGKMKSNVGGFVNVESAPLIAAGLSVNVGIMYGGGNVNALLNWQRLSPPMSVFEADYQKSERRLTDYKYGDVKPVFWTDFYGKDFEVSAPAITSRGTRLPEVENLDQPPFVMASCNSKTNAYAVSTLSRVMDPNNKVIVLADVKIFPKDIFAPIGVFGYYKNLTVQFEENLPENAKIYAQCLLDDEAFEITDKVDLKENSFNIDGKLLRLFGRSKDAFGYKEDPAVVIQIIT